MADVTTSETVIHLTEDAVRRIRSLQAQSENAGKLLRVYVEECGCSGMQYGMVFDQPRDGDLTAHTDGVCVLLDPFSAGYLRDAVLDFSAALTGGGFKIANPQARESCGCGKSFAT